MDGLKEKIELQRLPKHIAIIMDGNGRWAKKKGLPRTLGHQNGVKSVREITEASAELGVEYLTLYAFSIENWNSPKLEIDALMRLLVKTINKETKTLNDNNIRLNAIGDIKSLPADCCSELKKSIESTASNTRMILNLALSYSSRWEIVNAIKKIATKVSQNKINIEDINEQILNENLSTSTTPDPDLLIRTGGELRVSNFLLYQIAYSELYFTDKLWPNFRKKDLYEAIIDYQSRERRFGKTSEQIN